ncbi:MAG TPA: MG2 domain-containing protein [Bryobacteraceae bacterium]|jgi:hypothetical protein
MKKWWPVVVGALLLLAGGVLDSFQQSKLARDASVGATYSHGVLHATISYSAARAGYGELAVQVLDPEGGVLGKAERPAIAASGIGVWRVDVPLDKPAAIEDLVWQRLQYRFAYWDGKGPALEDTEAISRILRTPVLRIVGQQSYLSGSRAAVRVVVNDSSGRAIEGPGAVRIELAANNQKTRLLYAGPLNQRGTTAAQFRFPAGLVGNFPLHYAVDTPIGSTEYTEQVRLQNTASILLTTEKPLYQPGQTIHIRALALDRANRNAAGGRALTFELEDSRGNKVFRKVTQTDTLGVASAEFGLADEVNLGTYHLRAAMDSNAAEIGLNVERYVLPKFKVAVELDARKHGYRPGYHVTGTVRANYFFGKAVDGAPVTIKVSGMDVARFESAPVQGKTDSDGAYKFDLPLPGYFAGRPLNQGSANVLIEADVKDSANHTETRGEPIAVSESPLIVTAVPEGGTVIPRLENQLFILTSYADGKPASASVTVHGAGEPDQTATTDEGGVAVVRLRDRNATIDATDKEGNRASTSVQLQSRSGDDQILLRTERAVYRAGDSIQLKIFSTKKRGSAYVDVVKEGQTILTRDLDIADGQAELTLAATPAMAGALDIDAYIFGSNAQAVSDHRLVFVQPADDLKIEATADAASYKPGDDARIRFRVTNSRGEGVQAALGLQVVDEAVFALAEKQPGFAKVFFYLEQEAMKPRYEIHSIGMPEVVEPVSVAQSERRDRAARALFSATEMVNSNKFETVAGQNLTQAKFAEYFGRYQKAFQTELNRAAETMTRAYKANSHGGDLSKVAADVPAFRDPWGNDLRFEGSRGGYSILRSAGPDKQFSTQDDLVGFLQVRNGAVVAGVFGQGFAGGRIRVGGDVAGVLRGFGGAVVGGVPGGVIGGIAGGGGGGARFQQFDAGALIAPPAPAREMVLLKTASAGVGAGRPIAPEPQTHVRSYFPEALYINPEVITDRDGRASIAIPMADSITTWRMAMLASTARGALGSGTSSIKVFQDFFVDLDLPVTLTQGDRVSIPVAVYNYSGASGEASLQLQPADWFSLVNDTAAKTVSVDSGRVGASQFTLEARRIGKFKLTLSARMQGQPNADIVVREIEVVPNGREQTEAFNGRLETSASHEIRLPANSIPDASKIFVRLYPGPLSQIVEGMDAILRMPNGCFEQTSSATYPNVLALDYMKNIKKLTPEIHAKAEGYIAQGYQRLLTFEVPGGGFSWFGQAPANKILTAYGLMEFSDMAKVHDVDANVIRRTQQWLANQQQPDGSWKPDQSFINEGATNRFNNDALRITGYIAWSLENTGYQGAAVDKAKQFVERHMGGSMDAYTLAVLANFATDYGKDRDFERQAMQLLLDARKEQNDRVWWDAQETGVYATGASAAVETTGLAAQGLLKWGEASTVASKAMNYIASKKDASGAWGTTQATIMALRALLLSTGRGASDVQGAVQVTLNGKPVENLALTPDNNDLFHQFVFKNVDSSGPNAVAIRFQGKGSLAYQVSGDYFVPWSDKSAQEPLSIDVSYDRTQLAQDDIATAKATVKSNLSKTANMVMVDLGIPPGFDLISDDLQLYKDKSAGLKSGRLEKFSLTATQAILYFDSIGGGDTVTLRYRLRAKYPIRARTFPSRVYEYYDPDVTATARPVQLEVRKR